MKTTQYQLVATCFVSTGSIMQVPLALLQWQAVTGKLSLQSISYPAVSGQDSGPVHWACPARWRMRWPLRAVWPFLGMAGRCNGRPKLCRWYGCRRDFFCVMRERRECGFLRPMGWDKFAKLVRSSKVRPCFPEGAQLFGCLRGRDSISVGCLQACGFLGVGPFR